MKAITLISRAAHFSGCAVCMAIFSAGFVYAQSQNMAADKMTMPIAGEILRNNVQDIPIADAHFHMMGFMTPASLKEQMDKHNVRWIISAGSIGRFGNTDNSLSTDLNVVKEIGDRYLPAVGWSDIRSAESDEGVKIYTDPSNARRDSVIRIIDEQLSAGRRVIGETFPNAETSHAVVRFRRRVPTDSVLFIELYKLSVKHGVPIPMHMQWHPSSVEQLGNLLLSDSRGVVVLSHCGKDTEASDIRRFFEKYSNVFCDLGFRSPPQATAESLKDPARTIFWGKGMFREAGIKPEWAKLIEDYPDRFMVAIDDVHSWGMYEDVVEAIRNGVLANLSGETAEKVAYKNALRIFRLRH